MSRDRGDWIPWYVEDSPSWLSLSLAARGLAEGIARKMGRKRSELPLGSRGIRGLEQLMGRPWTEIEPAIRELLAKGTPTDEFPDGTPARLVYDSNRRVLVDLDHETRRLGGSAERMHNKRSRERPPSEPPSPTVTSDLPPSQPVTRDVTSPLLSSDLISSPGEGAGGGAPEPPTWWGAACDTVAMSTGEAIEKRPAWLRYWGHRSSTGKRVAQPDAVYWLTTVDAKEARKERRDDEHRRNRAGPAPPSETRKLTAEERKREAEMAVALMRGDKKPPRSGTDG